MIGRNRESATNLYEKAKTELLKQAQDPTTAGRASEKLNQLESIANAPSLYKDVGKVVRKVFGRKPKQQAASAAPAAPSVPVSKPAVKAPARTMVDPGKPVNEKNPTTEPIDIIGDGPVELIPPAPDRPIIKKAVKKPANSKKDN